MNTKEKVLQKCAELRNPSAPWINEEWDLKRYVTTNRWELHRHKGLCDIRYQFRDDVPDDDPVWPLAAQALGIIEQPKPQDSEMVRVALYGLLTPIKALTEKLEKAATLIPKPKQPTKSPKPDWVKEELAQMQEEKPNGIHTWRELLGIAFSLGYNCGHKRSSEADSIFREWLKTLPPDTIKEDRELVKVMVLNDGGSFVKRYSENVVVALKRLCGMEVGG